MNTKQAEELLTIERAREKRDKTASKVGQIAVLIFAGPPIALIIWAMCVALSTI